MASPVAKDPPDAAEGDAKSPSSGRFDVLGILKIIPEKQRLLGLVFLIGESMLAGIYPWATPEAKNWAFGAIVVWPCLLYTSDAADE